VSRGFGFQRVWFERFRQRRAVLEMRPEIEQIRCALECVLPHRGRGPRDSRRIDSLLLLEVRTKHEGVAQAIDPSRIAGREDEDLGEGRIFEFRSARPASAVQAVLDVQAHLCLLERTQVTIDADQLTKAAPWRGVKQDPQLGMPDQADLQFGRSQVGRTCERLKQIEGAPGEVLGFVDHEQSRLGAPRKRGQQRVAARTRVRLSR